MRRGAFEIRVYWLIVRFGTSAFATGKFEVNTVHILPVCYIACLWYSPSTTINTKCYFRILFILANSLTETIIGGIYCGRQPACQPRRLRNRMLRDRSLWRAPMVGLCPAVDVRGCYELVQNSFTTSSTFDLVSSRITKTNLLRVLNFCSLSLAF